MKPILFIFIFLSTQSFANLKNDLTSLRAVESRAERLKLIEAISASTEFDEIPNFEFSPQQRTTILKIWLEENAPFVDGLILNLIKLAWRKENEPSNTVIKAFVKYWHEINSSSHPLRFMVGNIGNATLPRMLEEALDGILADKQQFDMLIAALNLKLQPDNLARLMDTIRSHPNFVKSINDNIVPSPAVTNANDAEKIFLETVINGNGSGLFHAQLVLSLFKNAPSYDKQWRANIKSLSDTAVKQFADYLQQGLSVNDEFSTVLGSVYGADETELQTRLLKVVSDDLTQIQFSEHRLRTFSTILSQLKKRSIAPEEILTALGESINYFIAKNWRRLVTELNDAKTFISTYPPVDIRLSLLTDIAKDFTVTTDIKAELRDANLLWLYDGMIENILLQFLQLSDNISPAIPLLKKKFLVDKPALWLKGFPLFTLMNITDSSPQIEQEQLTISEPSFRSKICNNEGYGKVDTQPCSRGKSLKLDDVTPIGYNILIPDGDVRAIFTLVYGGSHKKRPPKLIFSAESLSPLQKYLATKGIALVSLNLLDSNELDVHQTRMGQDLHERLHRSIHRYFQAIKNGELGDELSILKDVPNYLYGASFGGRTAIKHAEKYPTTFAGYISFNGALDESALNKSLSPFRGSEEEINNPVIDPARDIEKIERPILVLQNIDDNNVNVSVALSWYKKALQTLKPLGRDNLIRLLLTSKGSPFDGISDDAFLLKGHFFPVDRENFMRLANYVLQFMTTPSNLTSTSALTANAQQWYADRMNPSAPLKERFLSEAFFHYATHQYTNVDEKQWLEIYAPMLAALTHVDKIVRDYSVAEEIARLMTNGLLTDEVIEKTLASFVRPFSLFLVELNNWQLTVDNVADALAKNPLAIAELRTIIKDIARAQATTRNYLLRKLFLANPGLLPPNSDVNTVETREAKAEFLSRLSITRDTALDTWRESTQQVKLTIAQSFDAFITKLKDVSNAANRAFRLEDFIELLRHLDPALTNLNNRLEALRLYRQLLSDYESCKTTTCMAHYVATLCSLHLITGDKEAIKRELTTLAESSSSEEDAVALTKTILPQLQKALSARNQQFSVESMLEMLK